MKTLHAFLLVLFFFFTSFNIGFCVDEDCLCLFSHDILSESPWSDLVNPNAVKVDSCDITEDNCPEFLWKYVITGNDTSKMYSIKGWSIQFDEDVIILPAVEDTILYVTWQHISDDYQDVKTAFQNVETDIGSFLLRKHHTDFTTGEKSQRFSLLFNDYANVLEVNNTLVSIPHLEYSYHSMVDIHTNIFDNREGNFEVYPNPFSNSTTINYTIENPAMVRINVYDNLGTEISTLINEFQDAGTHKAQFNAENLLQGVYFYKIQIDNATESGHLLLIR